MKPIIKVENIGKQYRLGNVGTGTLSHDITRWWQTSILGKEDPYLKIGEVNDRTKKGGSDYVWALQDINFEVQPGEILGIIGKNGAGKSTLLKLLSRVTAPTTGKITCFGRIASLLEVGTGFHPELTGRENIYLNGAILGMSKKEIAAKFDEIVDFAGCAKYIETPVKRYSSGMYVRLAFAVAAHLEPDILVVDEVLAVGDAEFQKKAIGKMKEVSEGQGRTVLFVSHNMTSVQRLCTRGIILENGIISQMSSNIDTLINTYLSKESNSSITSYTNRKLSSHKHIELLDCHIEEEEGFAKIHINYIVRRTIGSVVAIKLVDIKGTPILTLKDDDLNSDLFNKNEGKYQINFKIPTSFLMTGHYKITISFSDMKAERFDYYPELLTLFVRNTSSIDMSKSREGFLLPKTSYIENAIKQN